MDAGFAAILLNRYAAIGAKALISRTKKMSSRALARAPFLY
jgi:hypothetical protein